MAARPRSAIPVEAQESIAFIKSGNPILDLVLGGGWPLGRVSNIAGDRSSGKTLLAIEAVANFVRQFPTGVIKYVEAEAAFDESYAEALGMPVKSVSFARNLITIEQVFEDLTATIKSLGPGQPCLYIVDSLDALSDDAEAARGISEGSFGAAKAKKLSELFRRTIRGIEEHQMHLMVISQIRENIGVTFGEKYSRSGGKALDFYASQILWLAEIEKLKKTIRGQERVIGIKVRARCKKNKVGTPFRECEMPILFGYGIDDVTSMIEWLAKLPDWDYADAGLNERSCRSSVSKLRDAGGAELVDLRNILAKQALAKWEGLESEFKPKVAKY